LWNVFVASLEIHAIRPIFLCSTHKKYEEISITKIVKRRFLNMEFTKLEVNCAIIYGIKEGLTDLQGQIRYEKCTFERMIYHVF